jgi:uncharacterized protein (DUF58 family)
MLKINPAIDPKTPQGFVSQPSGYLLHKASLFILWGILLLAAWRGQTGIVILLGLVFGAAGLAAIWSRVSLAGVRCQRFIHERRLFPGEATELTLQIINRKPLPLPWIKIDDEIPAGVAGNLPALPAARPGFGLLSRSASILWYSKASWKCRLQGGKRGYYKLGPMRITSGDIFGFYPRWASVPLTDYMIVYPRIFPLDQLGIPSLHPMGESRSNRRIFQDPTRTIGIQDYRPQDSPKHIHWKASARRQCLQVKVFEPTTTLKVSLFLAADGFQPIDMEDFELAVSVAASVAYCLIEQGTPVGLISNSSLADSGLEVRIPPGGSRDQLMEILEALAKVTPQAKDSMETILQRESNSLPSGTTLILIASKAPESLRWLLNDLKEKGHKLLLLLVGVQQKTGPEGVIPTYHIRHPGNFLEVSPEVQA